MSRAPESGERLGSVAAAYLRAVHAENYLLADAIRRDVGADLLLAGVAAAFVHSLEGPPDAFAALFDEIEGGLVYRLPERSRPIPAAFNAGPASRSRAARRGGR